MDDQVMQHYNNLRIVCTQALQGGIIKDFEVAVQVKISLDAVGSFLEKNVPKPEPDLQQNGAKLTEDQKRKLAGVDS